MLRIPLVIFLIIFSIRALAQSKRFENVYESKNYGKSWEGFKKTNLVGTLTKSDKGASPIILILQNLNTGENLGITLKFEAYSNNGAVRHEWQFGPPQFPNTQWSSATGSSTVTDVFLNAEILKIFDESAPFLLEISFADNSAMRYFVAP